MMSDMKESEGQLESSSSYPGRNDVEGPSADKPTWGSTISEVQLYIRVFIR